MKAVPEGANSVQVTYIRSWNGVQPAPGVATAVPLAQAVGLLSIPMNCLSSRGRNVVWRPVWNTGRPGKLYDAPLFCVERKTKKPLARSGSPAVAGPRVNIWQDRYALPLLSQPTEVSPLACQYSRGNAVGLRVKLFGTVVSFQVRPLSRL